MTGLSELLARVARDLDGLGVPWALVGGLAVSVRAEPRFTRDVDLVASVADDAQAEALIAAMTGRGYAIATVLEQEAAGRLATIRLVPPAEKLESGRLLDLIFASCGIESEVVAAADTIEVFADVLVPVAKAGHLLAMKALSRNDETRPQDLVDMRALVAAAPDEIARARQAVALIQSRGYHRGKDLARELQRVLG